MSPRSPFFFFVLGGQMQDVLECYGLSTRRFKAILQYFSINNFRLELHAHTHTRGGGYIYTIKLRDNLRMFVIKVTRTHKDNRVFM